MVTALEYLFLVEGWKLSLYFFKKNGLTPASFWFIFGLFKQTILLLQQINVKKCPNVHPVYGTMIQTLDLLNMSRNPWPLDQSSRP